MIPQTYIRGQGGDDEHLLYVYNLYYLSLCLCLDLSITIQVDITGLVPFFHKSWRKGEKKHDSHALTMPPKTWHIDSYG